MTLPYSTTSSGIKAIEEIKKMIRGIGCTKFASGEDFETGEVYVHFEHKGIVVNINLTPRGYADAWLRENPHTPRKKCSLEDHKAKALEIGAIAIYSIIRDHVKSQLVMIEIGAKSFAEAFLPDVILQDGVKVIDKMQQSKMLPPPKD